MLTKPSVHGGSVIEVDTVVVDVGFEVVTVVERLVVVVFVVVGVVGGVLVVVLVVVFCVVVGNVAAREAVVMVSGYVAGPSVLESITASVI